MKSLIKKFVKNSAVNESELRNFIKNNKSVKNFNRSIRKSGGFRHRSLKSPLVLKTFCFYHDWKSSTSNVSKTFRSLNRWVEFPSPGVFPFLTTRPMGFEPTIFRLGPCRSYWPSANTLRLAEGIQAELRAHMYLFSYSLT